MLQPIDMGYLSISWDTYHWLAYTHLWVCLKIIGTKLWLKSSFFWWNNSFKYYLRDESPMFGQNVGDISWWPSAPSPRVWSQHRWRVTRPTRTQPGRVRAPPDAVIIFGFNQKWCGILGFNHTNMGIDRFNGHSRNLNWRYLLYIYIREYSTKIWPYMVQYLYFRILEWPLIDECVLSLSKLIFKGCIKNMDGEEKSPH